MLRILIGQRSPSEPQRWRGAIRIWVWDILPRRYRENSDGDRYPYHRQGLQKAIADYQPHLIGLRSVSQNYNEAKKIARMAHQAQIPVFMGGIHITALPQSLDRHMTLGCLGEGEETIVELIRLFIDKGKFPLKISKRSQGFFSGKEMN